MAAALLVLLGPVCLPPSISFTVFIVLYLELAFPRGPLLTAHPPGVVSFKHFLLVGIPLKAHEILVQEIC